MPVYLVVLAVSTLLVPSPGNRLDLAWLGDLQGQAHFWFWPSGPPRPVWAYVLAHLTMLHGALPPGALPPVALPYESSPCSARPGACRRNGSSTR